MKDHTRGSFVLLHGFCIAFAVASSSLAGQNATLTGVVLNEGTERPLVNAEIAFATLKRAVRTDSLGRFTITGLPAGKQALQVRLAGFEPFIADITFSAAQTVEADVVLRPIATTLKGVEVKAKSSTGPWAIKLAEFEERRSMGIGRFVTADVFEAGDGQPTSSLLKGKLAGLKVVQVNGHRWLASARGPEIRAAGADPTRSPMLNIPRACYLQVVVNGLVQYNGNEGQELFDIDALNSKDIIGIELYTTATTPLQYNGTKGKYAGNCGTVIIWTKGG